MTAEFPCYMCKGFFEAGIILTALSMLLSSETLYAWSTKESVSLYFDKVIKPAS